MESFQSNSLLEGVKDMDTLVILVAGSANMSSVLKMAVVYHANLSIPWSRRDRPTAPWLNFVAKQRATPHTIRWGWWQFINADIQRCPMRENDNISLQSERALTNRVHVKNPSLVCGAEIQARLETEIQARLETESSVCCSGVHMCNVLLLYFLHWLRTSTFRWNWVRWPTRPTMSTVIDEFFGVVNKIYFSARHARGRNLCVHELFIKTSSRFFR